MTLPTHSLAKGTGRACSTSTKAVYPFAFHRILIKEGFTCFISAPTSKPAVIQPGSQVAVRSVERWVVEPRKRSIRHKPETTLYCPHLTFSPSRLLLEFFPTAELHLPWKSPSALLHVLFHSPRQHFPVRISNSLFLLLRFQAAPWAGSQTSPQEGHRGLSQSHACQSWASHSALPSSPHLQLTLPLLRNLLWGWKPFWGERWGSRRDMLQPQHLRFGSCLWLFLR